MITVHNYLKSVYSVALSVICHTSNHCNNGLTDENAILMVD